MLKKLSIAMAVLVTSITSAFAAGTPYVGLLAGLNSSANSHVRVDKVTPIGLFGGYGARMGEKGYLGAELSLDYFLGLSVIPGLMLTDNTMLYGRAGSASTTVKNKTTGNSKFLTGERVGLGLQTNLTKHLDVRGEYDYATLPKFNGTSPQVNSFNVGLVYNFN